MYEHGHVPILGLNHWHKLGYLATYYYIFSPDPERVDV